MSENGPAIADLVFHSPSNLAEPERAFREKAVKQDISLRHQTYEMFDNLELSRDVNIERAKSFVEQYIGEKPNPSIFFINNKDKDRLNKLNQKENSAGDSEGQYDPDTNDVVVFGEEESHPIMKESVLVHELAHSTGIKVMAIYPDNEDQVGYKGTRGGLRVGTEHGEFLEELIPSHLGQQYKVKYSDEITFEVLSQRSGKAISSFEETQDFEFSYPSPQAIEKVEIPLKYADIDKGEVVAGQTALIAYSFDLLDRAVYEKTKNNLKDLLMEARKDPHKIKDLSKVIDDSTRPGTYQMLRKTRYGGDEALPSLISTIKYLQTVT